MGEESALVNPIFVPVWLNDPALEQAIEVEMCRCTGKIFQNRFTSGSQHPLCLKGSFEYTLRFDLHTSLTSQSFNTSTYVLKLIDTLITRAI